MKFCYFVEGRNVEKVLGMLHTAFCHLSWVLVQLLWQSGRLCRDVLIIVFLFFFSVFRLFMYTSHTYIRGTQGCQIFLGTIHQNGKYVPNNHKVYQTTPKNVYQRATKYTKWPSNIPKWNIPTFSIPRPSKIYPNWDFGMQIYHLAPLVWHFAFLFDFVRLCWTLFDFAGLCSTLLDFVRLCST
jgi:hypothetical protein